MHAAPRRAARRKVPCSRNLSKIDFTIIESFTLTFSNCGPKGSFAACHPMCVSVVIISQSATHKPLEFCLTVSVTV